MVGEEEVDGGRYEDLIAIGGRNAATASATGATSFVPNNWLYGLFDTESPRRM